MIAWLRREWFLWRVRRILRKSRRFTASFTESDYSDHPIDRATWSRRAGLYTTPDDWNIGDYDGDGGDGGD